MGSQGIALAVAFGGIAFFAAAPAAARPVPAQIRAADCVAAELRNLSWIDIVGTPVADGNVVRMKVAWRRWFIHIVNTAEFRPPEKDGVVQVYLETDMGLGSDEMLQIAARCKTISHVVPPPLWAVAPAG